RLLAKRHRLAITLQIRPRQLRSRGSKGTTSQCERTSISGCSALPTSVGNNPKENGVTQPVVQGISVACQHPSARCLRTSAGSWRTIKQRSFRFPVQVSVPPPTRVRLAARGCEVWIWRADLERFLLE